MKSSSTLKQLRVADTAPQAWRNGGGSTRELLAWPAGADWRVRISVAGIAADGPFSAFDGVERWFAVLSGAGVVLGLPGGERRLTPTSAPLRFDGSAAPGCRLIDGATSDLNLMLRAGTRGVLKRAPSDAPWVEDWRWRAAFVADSARLEAADGLRVELEAGTLLAPLPPGPCRLVASSAAAPMFWIGVDAEVEG